MQSHFFKVQRTARFHSLGDEKAPFLLIALHGYGQLTEYFLRKFQSLSSDWYVVAPEGMHRFYTQGFSGRVGASWMTKEMREMDIEDNNQLLMQLLHQLTATNHYQRVVLLGFSQGGATAARFFYQMKPSVDQLIMWASVFPPDIDKENEFKQLTNNQKNHFVLGDEDEFFTTTQQKEAHQFFADLGYKTVSFHGKHDIDATILKELLK
jgi:predicted esterase